MNLEGMDKTVDKLILIADKRLRDLRTKEITDIQAAEYAQLLKDSDWYLRVKNAVRDAKGGSATARQHIYSLLDERVEGRIKDIEDQTLDNIRMSGAGTMPDGVPEVVKTMTEDDKKFLKSCGIKGEIWPL